MIRRLLLILVVIAVVFMALGACWPEKEAEPSVFEDASSFLVETTIPPTTTTIAPTTTVPRPRPTTPRPSRKAAPAPRPTPTPQRASGDLYDALASCESGDGKGSINPQATSRNGKYVGAFQFAWGTWANLIRRLGLPYSNDPRNHSYAEQKDVVVRGIPVSSWGGQFPVCSRRIGAA